MRIRKSSAAASLSISVGLLAGLTNSASGQAPTSNQRWQVRYQIDRYLDATAGGGLLSTENVTGTWNGSTWSFTGREYVSGDVTSILPIGRVDITLQGRVGIVGQNPDNPGDTARPASQRNYGINRLGGGTSFSAQGVPTSGFRMVFRDGNTNPAAAPDRLELGLTGETRPNAVTGPGPVREYVRPPGAFTGGDPTDPSSYGDALRGAFMPFRVGFVPQGGQFAQGQNIDTGGIEPGVPSNNGTVIRLPTGEIAIVGITAGRASNFGADGTTTPVGVASLDASNQIIGGDWANYYRMTYTPNALATSAAKTVTVTVAGQTTRYLYQRNTSTTYSTSNGFTMPTHSFDFLVSSVPAPGSAVAAVLGGLLAARRRR